MTVTPGMTAWCLMMAGQEGSGKHEWLEKRGKELQEQGVTKEELEMLEDEAESINDESQD